MKLSEPYNFHCFRILFCAVFVHTASQYSCTYQFALYLRMFFYIVCVLVKVELCHFILHLCVLLYFVFLLCFFAIGENDLQQILEEVEQVTNVLRLGLKLGLPMSEIVKIQKEYELLEEQKTWVIYFWLQRMHIIPSKQSVLPTWNELANAVAKENVALSETIRQKYCKESS